MRVIELEDVVRGEGVELGTMQFMPLLQHVLEAGGRQKILLTQPQFLTLFALVIGVKHHGDLFGAGSRLHRIGVAAGVELIEIELLRGLGLPQAQGVDHAITIARNRHVTGDGEYVIGLCPAHAVPAVRVPIVIRVAAEADALGVLRHLEFPGVAVAQPAIRVFHLEAIANLLLEHAVLVANAIAGHGQAEAGTAVEKTGGETP